MLEEIGHVVLKVGSGGAALDLLDQHTGVDLVLLDFAMPGMSGVAVKRKHDVKKRAARARFNQPRARDPNGGDGFRAFEIVVVRMWPNSDLPQCPLVGRCQVQTGH
jgi:CheY-like chemotaxis protein